MEEQFKAGEDFALDLDKNDPLRKYRESFFIPEKDTIYLDGNSLGRLPLKTIDQLKNIIEKEWGTRLIRSWNEGWYKKSTELGDKLAKIIGASPREVIIGDSTSLNLYKLAYAAIKLNTGRKKIISDEFNFPTDLYVLQGITDQLGGDYEIQLAKSTDGITIDYDSMDGLIDEETALVTLSHVAFKSAFKYDIKKVTRMAHEKGALVIWDLSHSAGALPVRLNEANADMAIGCTYKYLNGGPGSPAYLYIKKELLDKLDPPIYGWFGDRDPFAFNLKYHPAENINKFLVGTPPILSMSAIGPALDIIIDAGIEEISQKSILQTEYLVFLVNHRLKQHGFEIGSPEDPMQRGSHVSVRHPEGYRICQALINPKDTETKVIPDFREPDNIRLGIAPLYNSFEDIYRSIERMGEIMKNRSYEFYSNKKSDVT